MGAQGDIIAALVCVHPVSSCLLCRRVQHIYDKIFLSKVLSRLGLDCNLCELGSKRSPCKLAFSGGGFSTAL